MITAASARAFAPGRVNLIGEHTDYSGGLALPFAVAMGVTVTVIATRSSTVAGGVELVDAAVAELRRAGVLVPAVEVSVRSDLPSGVGLSSSAAVTVASVLALGALAGVPAPSALKLARLCQRVEHSRGVHSGLLDQLAVILGRAGEATLIDFDTLQTRQVPVDLGGARLALLDSGERRELVDSGYNARREESARGVPERVRHIKSENTRVLAFIDAMGDPVALGEILDASHASLRDDYEVSTPGVEAAVARAREAGAYGARIMGGGFGGAVLALFPGGGMLPDGAIPVSPAAGARLL